MGATLSVWQPNGTQQTAVSEAAGIDVLMRRLMEQGHSEPAGSQTAGSSQPQQPRRDFDMACDLLEQATRAFDVLLNRCERLERELSSVTEQAKAQAKQQDETCQQWRTLAEGMQRQVQAADQNLKTLQAQCDATEARAATAEARSAALEKDLAQATDQAQKADVLSTKLHDKVVTTFGIGSRAHSALQAVVTEILAD